MAAVRPLPVVAPRDASPAAPPSRGAGADAPDRAVPNGEPPNDGLPNDGLPNGAVRPDLAERDLPALLRAFYAAAAREPLLAPYFAPLDMAAHIPRIADFWATVLFHAGRYAGNAFQPHLALAGLGTPHFARWLAVLEATVDARHAGPAAEQMKAVGHRIAYAMQLRLGLSPGAG